MLLGEELRPALAAVVVRLQQRRQELLAQLVGAVQAERADQPCRAGDGTRVAALARMREQEEEACLLERLRAEDPRCPDGAARPPRTRGGTARPRRPSSALPAPAGRRAGRPPARRRRRTRRAAPSRRTSARDRDPRRSPRAPMYALGSRHAAARHARRGRLPRRGSCLAGRAQPGPRRPPGRRRQRRRGAARSTTPATPG